MTGVGDESGGSPKFERAAMRWLGRYLDESSPTLVEIHSCDAGTRCARRLVPSPSFRSRTSPYPPRDLIRATGNLKAVQKLGHKSIQTTGDIYTDWDAEQLAESLLEAVQDE